MSDTDLSAKKAATLYFDHSATTPVDPRVLTKIIPFFSESFGNPSSQNHALGWSARNSVEEARNQVAKLLGAQPLEINFTSGATESNNWVFSGLFSYLKRERPQEKIHIISALAEHASVVEPIKYLEENGVMVTWVKMSPMGQVTPEEISRAIRPETKLVSIMSGNNEIGSLNPIKEIGALCKQHSIYFHTDATQTVGKIPIDVVDMNIHLLSFSGHKMCAPKGAGALYIRRRDPKVLIDPYMRGGGQEHGLRSGTVNVPLVVGLGEASRLALEELNSTRAQLTEMAYTLWNGIKQIFPEATLNGHPTERIPGHLSLTIPGFSHAKVLPKLGGLALSTASACSSDNPHGSPALHALGMDTKAMESTYRLTIGKTTTPQQIQEVLEIFRKIQKGSSH
ncbi:MAG: cysteine desulfurase family protein [Bdellovibrionota bacterium]